MESRVKLFGHPGPHCLEVEVFYKVRKGAGRSPDGQAHKVTVVSDKERMSSRELASIFSSVFSGEG